MRELAIRNYNKQKNTTFLIKSNHLAKIFGSRFEITCSFHTSTTAFLVQLLAQSTSEEKKEIILRKSVNQSASRKLKK